jgi:alkylated DNA repair dioxygenase AlkB
MKPLYIPSYAPETITIEYMLNEILWGTFTDARQECFMANEKLHYTYGSGRGVRTYESMSFNPVVLHLMNMLNERTYWSGNMTTSAVGLRCKYNVCFLNRYDDAGQHLGWHADDSPGMSHEHPIAVISFGQAREIWWRKFGQKGEIPADQRQLLENGSLFEMPPGFQKANQHRIPKGDRAMGPRVSLTYRHYVPEG